MLTQSDSYNLKLRKIHTSKFLETGKKRFEPNRKNSEIPETSEGSIETAKKKVKTWMDDGSSDD